ncbi:MAG: imidazole glycerol phosphate synthase subunit HisH [Candidatus Latescibacteria bacterium]|jgi:imidazole glycerol-phosphate synthase subunit HisH|nr:imidazole glycerol phosphate synthase subunit HisH [Candidatus Latescibacterota bacterium]
MIHIIDYEAGNATSVKRALDHMGVASTITKDSDEVRGAERLIFPGVGRAKSAMRVLKETGIDRALTDAYWHRIPILGICIGCQIIMTRSEEDEANCLDLIQGNCRRFEPVQEHTKVPHMGWNRLAVKRHHPILEGLSPIDEVYFVHSYYPEPSESSHVFATSDHEIEFTAALGHRNLFAVQFHVEKSGPVGLRMLKNFAEWDGETDDV